ncbi:hypothetical protein VTO73DRAFT_1252 [Trametes versicolor]
MSIASLGFPTPPLLSLTVSHPLSHNIVPHIRPPKIHRTIGLYFYPSRHPTRSASRRIVIVTSYTSSL